MTIRNQILLPFAATVTVAVATIAILTAWMSAERSERETIRQLQNIVRTLSSTALTYSPPILKKMQGLSGAHFIAVSRNKVVVASTITADENLLEAVQEAPLISSDLSFDEFLRIDLGDIRYFTARIKADGTANVSKLIVLYPESSWRELRKEAAWPPLVIGAIAIVIVFGISAWLAHRISQRVQSVQQMLAEIASGNFPATSEWATISNSSSSVSPIESEKHASSSSRLDELDALMKSAEELSSQLQQLQNAIRQTERIRTLAQLAGGLAHQLRNCVTGARLAIQLHSRRCLGLQSNQADGKQLAWTDRNRCGDDDAQDETLEVALRQLTLTEQHIKGLLSLTRKDSSSPQGCTSSGSNPGQDDRLAAQSSLHELIAEVERLIRPHAEHAHVDFEVSNDAHEQIMVVNVEQLRTASMNLVLNAIEAIEVSTDAAGRVELNIQSDCDSYTIIVRDNGTGPPDDLHETLFEPFVTSKPEGVGLGLALVKRVAEENGGQLAWHRDGGWTEFELSMPWHHA